MTPRRVLVVPAAGRGSRLAASLPKALVPVAGRPMLGWLLELYRWWVSGVVVVAHPTAKDAMRVALEAGHVPGVVTVQAEPTGMLDAVRLGCEAARPLRPDRIWITWCDQIAVRPETVARLAAIEADAPVALPLVAQPMPYIHFDRDELSRIVAVRQRREGHEMPSVGDSDIGLFSLSAHAAFDELPRFAATASADGISGERNFLPFIPWTAQMAPVVTFPATDPIEAIGINTPEELTRIEAYLRAR